MRFVGIGLVIYVLLLVGTEWLVRYNGRMNPIYKIDTAHGDFDWVILGASHAMPLDFGGFHTEMERETGKRILNLAGPGTGPLYNRFVLEHFWRAHRTDNILYVVDAFAFRSAAWNEGRFSDSGLMGRTPFHPALAVQLAGHVVRDGVNPRALLDYVTGFSKLNNRERFRRDVWEGEASFERIFRPSVAAERKRVDYLYPPVADERTNLARYLGELAGLIERAQAKGAAVTIIKFPLPPRFKSLLPGEAEFDDELTALLRRYGIALQDYSGAIPDTALYADTDHLNRAGVTEFFRQHLRAILTR